MSGEQSESVYENCLSLQGTGANVVDDWWCATYLNEPRGAYNPRKTDNAIRRIDVDDGALLFKSSRTRIVSPECRASLELLCNLLLNAFRKLPQKTDISTYIYIIRKFDIIVFLWNHIIYCNKSQMRGVGFSIPTNNTNLCTSVIIISY